MKNILSTYNGLTFIRSSEIIENDKNMLFIKATPFGELKIFWIAIKSVNNKNLIELLVNDF